MIWSLPIYALVVCIYGDCRIHIHGMAFPDDGMAHVVCHGVASHNSAPVVLCDVRVLYGIPACANGIRVFCALHNVVVVCNGRNDDVACILHGVMAYALHSAVAYAPRSEAACVLHSVAVYALRNVASCAHHNTVCVLHDVMDNELDPTACHMYLAMELVMLTQSPLMSQKLSEIQREK